MMAEKKSFPWWIIVLIIAFICILCLCVVSIAGLVSIGKRGISLSDTPVKGNNPITSYFESLFESILGDYLGTSSSAGNPTSSGQQSSANYFFDDFSSTDSGWPLFDDGKTILKYENGQYSLQVTEPDFFDWVYAPINFYASEIDFKLQGLPGPQNGTFGVFCQFHDIDNYYYIEFDLELQDYLVGVIVDGNETLLTVNPNNDDWEYAQGLLPYPEQVNNIHITCTQDYISLSINDQWNGDYQVTTPFSNPGDTAFFVYAFDFPDTDGYKAFIDDVELYNPNP